MDYLLFASFRAIYFHSPSLRLNGHSLRKYLQKAENYFLIIEDYRIFPILASETNIKERYLLIDQISCLPLQKYVLKDS